jgi:hypothetical protein
LVSPLEPLTNSKDRSVALVAYGVPVGGPAVDLARQELVVSTLLARTRLPTLAPSMILGFAAFSTLSLHLVCSE